MDKYEKEIQNLKRKYLYLSIGFLALLINLIFISLSQVKSYSIIQDYYFQSLDSDRELLLELEKQNMYLEEQIESLRRILSETN